MEVSLARHRPVPRTAVSATVSADCGFQILPHLVYLPDMAPTDFCLFPSFKKDLRGKHLAFQTLQKIGLKPNPPPFTLKDFLRQKRTGVRSVGRPEPIYDSPDINATRARFKAQEGQTAILQCQVENLGDKQFVWKLASEQIPLTIGLDRFSQDPRLSVGVRHDGPRSIWTLEIADVRLTDDGLYECQISSKQRHLRRIMTLTVTRE
ncbi:hemicentin-1 [Elysia marginata]|uniref:Hemicentin-1 n=1 Tax=Elysia marginata TaxID=1093978 RepID=A0AAV4GJ15_9GAST|nr:hemicentin-1 [Elysia marginata]